MILRPFEERDAEAVASLWQYWFRDKTRSPDPGLTALVRRLYLERPDADPEVVPLVAEGDDASMLGFLGVTTTPIEVDGRAGVLAGLFPPVVAPEAPTTVASFLLRKFLAGPQTFTVSDGGHVKFERIWETLGGRIAQLQSLRWVKLLRPARTAATTLTSRRRWRALAPVAGFLAGGADTIARRVQPSRFGVDAASWSGEPLTPEAWLEANATLHARTRLRPRYSAEGLAWLLNEMGRTVEQGRLAATLVRDGRGRIAGWYVAYLRPGGISRVFALDAAPRDLEGVVDHLFASADAEGTGALIGRLEPRLRRPMAARGCLAHNGGSLLMVHASDASLMDDALLGRLAFSRLDAENWYWWQIISSTVP